MGLGFPAGFDYVLPPERIAQVPLEDRAASRLLNLERETGAIHHRTFRDVVELLQPGDLLVRNNTLVTAMRLFGRKPSGAAVEALLMKRTSRTTFEALVKPGRRLMPGAEIHFEEGLRARVAEILDPGRVIEFEDVPDLDERLDRASLAPLPPYIHTHLADRGRYQTVYAKEGGSAAAPTAGLHFTEEINRQLDAKGVQFAEVTLDVGLDTFKPVDGDLSQHVMHGERCTVTEETALKVAQCQGRVIAVGTTTARTLETFAIGPRQLRTGTEVSRIFITPGFEFQIVDGMFTNFHMPRTTMLLMIAALAGSDAIANAYQEALREEYRFLSFGDSMLIL